MSGHTRILGILAACLILSACGDPVTDAARDITDARVDGRIGGDAVIWTGDGPVHVDPAPGHDPEGATAFRAGSLTKVFTQLAILRLVDEGRLDLDQSLASVRPGFNAAWAEAVTLRQLLTFSAGLPGEISDDPLNGVVLDSEGRGLAFMDGLVEPGPETGPGERTRYSNLSYFHLGAVIEAVTGLAYAEAVSQLVIEPLGLRDTGYGGPADGQEGRAGGYVLAETGRELVSDHPVEQRYASGGMHVSVRDLATTSQALVVPGFLSAGSLDEYFTQFGRPGGENPAFVEAGGHVPGFANGWIISREPVFAVAVLNNVLSEDPREVVALTRRMAGRLGAPVETGERYRPTTTDGWTFVETPEAIPARAFLPAALDFIAALQAGDAEDQTRAYTALVELTPDALTGEERNEMRDVAAFYRGIFDRFGPFHIVAWREDGDRLLVFLEGDTGERAIHLGFEADADAPARVETISLGTYGFRP
ncbi:serine hydrolase domain-containing protein [Hyphobacterium marinum]|uniref:Serine hydrolase domain-containing protein n=1 Tax=Hyphobacterium marinum TaxID=3116574 RepID=A0ABU7LUS3_9PROT|nr:serine hydrolase domain-containing protein [Hyphobacterium sp. Y6023]MEE2565295.1 serine hydrolase domain-containing protein [Hyphobacterium sp. Y6023]